MTWEVWRLKPFPYGGYERWQKADSLEEARVIVQKYYEDRVRNSIGGLPEGKLVE